MVVVVLVLPGAALDVVVVREAVVPVGRAVLVLEEVVDIREVVEVTLRSVSSAFVVAFVVRGAAGAAVVLVVPVDVLVELTVEGLVAAAPAGRLEAVVRVVTDGLATAVVVLAVDDVLSLEVVGFETTELVLEVLMVLGLVVVAVFEVVETELRALLTDPVEDRTELEPVVDLALVEGREADTVLLLLLTAVPVDALELVVDPMVILLVETPVLFPTTLVVVVVLEVPVDALLLVLGLTELVVLLTERVAEGARALLMVEVREVVDEAREEGVAVVRVAVLPLVVAVRVAVAGLAVEPVEVLLVAAPDDGLVADVRAVLLEVGRVAETVLAEEELVAAETLDVEEEAREEGIPVVPLVAVLPLLTAGLPVATGEVVALFAGGLATLLVGEVLVAAAVNLSGVAALAREDAVGSA